MEFQEYHWPFRCDDDTLEKFGPKFKSWNRGIGEASEKAKIKLDAVLKAPELLQNMGFVNVGYTGSRWPLGRWAKGGKEKRIG